MLTSLPMDEERKELRDTWIVFLKNALEFHWKCLRILHGLIFEILDLVHVVLFKYK